MASTTQCHLRLSLRRFTTNGTKAAGRRFSQGRDGAEAVGRRFSQEDRPRKLTYKEQRELEALPAKVEALEAEVAEIESALGDPALYAKDPARVAALTARLGPAKDELDAAETRWLELSMR